MRRLLPFGLWVLAACGGRPIESKQEIADTLAYASIPSVHAPGAPLEGSGVVPEPSVTVRGAHGGEATLSVNPVGGAIGLAAGAVLFDVRYSGYSEDGAHRLDGTLSVAAQFDYVAAAGEDPYADLKLWLVGRLRVSGRFSDELHLNVAITTRFHELSLREESLSLRLDGAVTIREQRFTFEGEDLSVLTTPRGAP